VEPASQKTDGPGYRETTPKAAQAIARLNSKRPSKRELLKNETWQKPVWV
jgi:hypothetical protein